MSGQVSIIGILVRNGLSIKRAYKGARKSVMTDDDLTAKLTGE